MTGFGEEQEKRREICQYEGHFKLQLSECVEEKRNYNGILIFSGRRNNFIQNILHYIM